MSLQKTLEVLKGTIAEHEARIIRIDEDLRKEIAAANEAKAATEKANLELEALLEAGKIVRCR